MLYTADSYIKYREGPVVSARFWVEFSNTNVATVVNHLLENSCRASDFTNDSKVLSCLSNLKLDYVINENYDTRNGLQENLEDKLQILFDRHLMERLKKISC